MWNLVLDWGPDPPMGIWALLKGVVLAHSDVPLDDFLHSSTVGAGHCLPA